MKMENISFFTDFAAEYDQISGSENQIKQACIAILQNSVESITENGEVILRTSNPSKDNILIEIKDNGSGINEDDIPHIFEPFFSAKDKASGIGLGLAIVHGIVNNHKGKIEVFSGQEMGTRLTILLPILKKSTK